MFSTLAWAQTQGGAAASPSILETVFPFMIVIVIFFLFIVRPQQRRAQEAKKIRESLKRGDSVLTTSGILGTIEGLTEQFVTLQIANGIKIRILRSAIAGPAADETEKK